MTDPISNERLEKMLSEVEIEFDNALSDAEADQNPQLSVDPVGEFDLVELRSILTELQSRRSSSVKPSAILSQIALWSDDEGLELSMGQGDDLVRRILSSLSVKEQEGYSAEDGLRRVREIAIQSVAAPFCMSEIVKVADMALGENTALPGWIGDLASHEPASGDTQDDLPLTDETQEPAVVKPVAWQRRLKYPDVAGAVPQWQSCPEVEATGHFGRSPHHEYRPLYTSPPPKAVTITDEMVERASRAFAAIALEAAFEADAESEWHRIASPMSAALTAAIRSLGEKT